MKVKSIIEKKPIRIMFQDEARFGRINEPRRCWTKKGLRPAMHKQIIREYTYVYGAFCPTDGTMDSLILPNMYASTMSVFLKEVSMRHKDELVLMVVDGAPCHRAGKLKLPHNIELLELPPYCPQLNPSENMWDELREKEFANKSFSSMNNLETHLCSALRRYESKPAIIKSITNWNWISDAIHSFFIAV